MKQCEIDEHMALLKKATRRAGRRLSGLEAYRLGIMLYESKVMCKRHGHNIKRVMSYNCQDCANEDSLARKELKRMEDAGVLKKIYIGGGLRGLWPGARSWLGKFGAWVVSRVGGATGRWFSGVDAPDRG